MDIILLFERKTKSQPALKIVDLSITTQLIAEDNSLKPTICNIYEIAYKNADHRSWMSLYQIIVQYHLQNVLLRCWRNPATQLIVEYMFQDHCKRKGAHLEHIALDYTPPDKRRRGTFMTAKTTASKGDSLNIMSAAEGDPQDFISRKTIIEYPAPRSIIYPIHRLIVASNPKLRWIAVCNTALLEHKGDTSNFEMPASE